MIAALDRITKERLLAHFDRLFFSKQTKRLDVELNRLTDGRGRQRDTQILNKMKEPMFKRHLPRLRFAGGVREFKKKASFCISYPQDYVSESFAK